MDSEKKSVENRPTPQPRVAEAPRNEEVDDHEGYVPTEEDYERARTKGAAFEDLPPGAWRKK